MLKRESRLRFVRRDAPALSQALVWRCRCRKRKLFHRGAGLSRSCRLVLKDIGCAIGIGFLDALAALKTPHAQQILNSSVTDCLPLVMATTVKLWLTPRSASMKHLTLRENEFAALFQANPGR